MTEKSPQNNYSSNLQLCPEDRLYYVPWRASFPPSSASSPTTTDSSTSSSSSQTASPIRMKRGRQRSTLVIRMSVLPSSGEVPQQVLLRLSLPKHRTTV